MSAFLLFLLACGSPKSPDTPGDTDTTDLDRTCDPIAPTLCGTTIPINVLHGRVRSFRYWLAGSF